MRTLRAFKGKLFKDSKSQIVLIVKRDQTAGMTILKIDGKKQSSLLVVVSIYRSIKVKFCHFLLFADRPKRTKFESELLSI